MLEYVIVLTVVLVAVVYVTKRFWRQLQGRGCEDCDCTEKARRTDTLVQIGNRRGKRK